MSIIPTTKLPLTAGTDFDFGGGDITSNGGVLLLNELCVALGVPEALRENLLEHPLREFDDCDVAYQQALMLACGRSYVCQVRFRFYFFNIPSLRIVGFQHGAGHATSTGIPSFTQAA